MLRTDSASGKPCQQGRFGGFDTTPVNGSRGPGAQIPTPRISAAETSRRRVSTAVRTEARPCSAVPVADIGVRVIDFTFPEESTNPAATLVPPTSTPTKYPLIYI